jgi:biotin/methionine sulfoxide reductase
VAVTPHPDDPSPSPILGNFENALRHKARVARPMVRRGWLENGPGPDTSRGHDDFVELEWGEALDRLAGELGRVRRQYGASAIYGGSYGWSSAGRFHHAQSQLHRFLNTALGGYVKSVNSYSSGAAEVILPHVLGPIGEVARHNVTWEQIAEHTDHILAFGGMAPKNAMIAPGGVSHHIEPDAMRRASARGMRFHLVSPLGDDRPEAAALHWLPIRPGADVALMLSLAHTLLVEERHDRAFLERYCTGFAPFAGYLLGETDGQPKDAAWAEAISGIAASDIMHLARTLSEGRTLITVAHALQRAEHGEQPVWMAAVLAAFLGQIGLPGGGYNYSMGAMANTGRRPNAVPTPALPQGTNGVADFIPVARVSDMLLHPDAPFAYNGQSLRYPDIKLVYWAGGNPFHHHQDLARLEKAVSRVDTLVVHETAWTATARHADIVLPATMTLERDDVGGTPMDSTLVAMHRIAPPFAQASDDYDIFAALARRLGAEAAFTEGRTSAEWLRHLYECTRTALADLGLEAPDFEQFWQRGELTLPSQPDDGGILRAFLTDPVANPLPTPSVKIEIFSATIAGFGYDDCPGHPAWLASTEPPTADYPLALIANQPATRLHSQIDFGGYSQSRKVKGREVVRINPDDAAARDIADGDIVRIYNARGACLAAAEVSDRISAGILHLPTGAWFAPAQADDGTLLCAHGNPNILTRDKGTSQLAQGSTGQITIANCEAFRGELPRLRVYDAPVPAPLPRAEKRA